MNSDFWINIPGGGFAIVIESLDIGSRVPSILTYHVAIHKKGKYENHLDLRYCDFVCLGRIRLWNPSTHADSDSDHRTYEYASAC